MHRNSKFLFVIPHHYLVVAAVDLRKRLCCTVWPWHKSEHCRCLDSDRKWMMWNRLASHLEQSDQSINKVELIRNEFIVQAQRPTVHVSLTNCIICNQMPVGRVVAKRQINDIIEHSFIAPFPCCDWILTQQWTKLIVSVIIVNLFVIVNGRRLFCCLCRCRRWRHRCRRRFEFSLFGVHVLQEFSHIARHEFLIRRQPDQRCPFSNQFFNCKREQKFHIQKLEMFPFRKRNNRFDWVGTSTDMGWRLNCYLRMQWDVLCGGMI